VAYRDSVEKTQLPHDDGLSKTWSSSADEKKRETRVEYDGFYRYTIAGSHIYILIYYINALVTSSRII